MPFEMGLSNDHRYFFFFSVDGAEWEIVHIDDEGESVTFNAQNPMHADVDLVWSLFRITLGTKSYASSEIIDHLMSQKWIGSKMKQRVIARLLSGQFRW